MAEEVLNQAQLNERTQHVRFVLVRPLFPANVGASARAMLNFGFENMVLIKPQSWNKQQASRMASGADHVYERARLCASVEEAVADCALVLGTTARPRTWSWPVLEPGPAAHQASEFIAAGSKIAVVFGPENYGLSNTDLQHCNALVHIPTAGMHDSLNLSQAVLLMCWELAKTLRGEAQPTPRKAVTSEELDGATRHIDAILQRINFYDGKNREQTMVTVRNFLSQADIRSQELQFLRGIVRKVSWHLDHPGHSVIPDHEDPFVQSWEKRAQDRAEKLGDS